MRTSPELILGLPIVPPYREGELIQSHLRRTADANHISSAQLGRILAGNTSKLTKVDSLKLAEQLTEKLGYPAGKVRSWTLLGCMSLHKRSSSKRQFCPECLVQEVTQSVHLDEPSYAICPVHGLAHYVKCPACRRDLFWGVGRLHLCACGFDFRDSERIKVSPEALELFNACLENLPLGDSQKSLSVDLPEDRMARLRNALEYLSTICAIEKGPDRGDLSPNISNEAHQWEFIGKKLQGDPKRLLQVAKEIEMRLVYTNTNPGTGVSKPEIIRKAITWSHLREVSQSAHQSVIGLEDTNDIKHIADSFGLDPQRVLSIQLLVNNCISLHARTELRAHFNGLKKQSGVNPEVEARRMAALISLAQELRCVHELSWLKHMQADNKVNLLAFIAAGALQPWAATTFRNWHVFLRDVERLSRRLQGQPFPQGRHGVMGDAYVVEFSQVFSERAGPSDWLGLSAREVRGRVERLVRASEYPITTLDGMQDRLALPVGFSAFLEEELLSICGTPQRNAGIEEQVLVSQSWEAAAQGLTQACLRAQANFARLADWQRACADIAWKYLTAIRNGTPAAEAMKETNAEVREGGGFTRKAMREAIERYEAPCGLP